MAAPLLSLSNRDWVKALAVAVGAAMLAALGTVVQKMMIADAYTISPNDLFRIFAAGLNGGVGYLLKQLGSDENGKILGKY